jgi:hypothetical protein
MKFKMFVGPDGKDIERQVNIWRREFPEFEVVKSETNISYHTIPDPSGSNQLQQRIAIVIWYNDGRSSEMRPLPFPTPPPQLRNSN